VAGGDAADALFGSQLLNYLEDQLRQRGVRVWFGNATPDLDVDRLRMFYERHGFRVLPDGAPLPPLLGKEWVMPGTAQPTFYLWKRLPG